MNERDSSTGWRSKELGRTKEDDELSRQPGSESFVFERNIRSTVQVFLCHSSPLENDTETNVSRKVIEKRVIVTAIYILEKRHLFL